MKTCTNSRIEKLNIVKLSQKLILYSLLALNATLLFAGDYQQNILFTPNKHILESEARGHVMIYDGLKNETVEKAMDQQFSRIESMMFIRTKYQQADGEVIADDDCDD